MNHYEYPNELYCVGCLLDVEPKIRTAHESMTNDRGKTISFNYNVAVCPNCGNVLCSRDRDFAFVKAIESIRKGGESDG